MIQTVVFDVGNVLYRWDRRLPFVAHFDDPAKLDHFLDENALIMYGHLRPRGDLVGYCVDVRLQR